MHVTLVTTVRIPRRQEVFPVGAVVLTVEPFTHPVVHEDPEACVAEQEPGAPLGAGKAAG